jgi:hypothetical protein
VHVSKRSEDSRVGKGCCTFDCGIVFIHEVALDQLDG